MSKAIIYIRVSTVEQVENHSLDTQRARCSAYCEQQGLGVVHVYSEEGESAKTADRTELQRMLKYCSHSARADGVTRLIVFRFDRFTRNMSDLVHLQELLGSFGVRVESATEQTDDSPSGQFMRNILAATAQFDNDTRSQRTREGMLTGLQKGRWQWKAPIGYLRSPPSVGGSSLVPDPITAHFVVKAFELTAEGARSRADVRRHLTMLGLRGFRGKPMTADTFNKMLARPIYYGRVQSKAFKFEGPGDFDPLVTKDLFMRAQRAMHPTVTHPGKHHFDNPDFPLRRVLTCPDCNGPLTGSWSRGRNGNRHAYYHCPKRGCHGMHRRADVEQAFMGFLSEQSVPVGITNLLNAAIRDTWKTRVGDANSVIERLQSELRTQETKRDELFDALVHRCVIDKATFDVRNARIESRIEDLRHELAAQSSGSLDLDQCLAFGEVLLRNLPECWNRLPMAQRPRFLKALFPQGLQYNGTLVGTAVTPWHNWGLGSLEPAMSGEVPPTGFEPVLPP